MGQPSGPSSEPSSSGSTHRGSTATGRYVDLHSHYLPALDDGSKSMEMSLEMISAVSALGFGTLFATPHQRAGMFMPSRDAIDDALAQTRAALAELTDGPSCTLGLGAENFWDDVLHERITSGGLPTYDGGKAFLFEVAPTMMPPRIETTLFQVRVSGRLPVVAHPERYVAIQDDIARAEAIGRTSALLVDLGSIDGAYGRAEMKCARRLVEEGLAHAAATDVHSPEDQRAAAAGMAWIRKRLGQATLDRLLDENPRRILAGELP